MADIQTYGQWAVVTGASAGIGQAFARRLAAAKINTVLVARRQDRLATLADELSRQHGTQSRVVPADLEQSDAPARIGDETKDLEVGILVNNAGFSAAGRFDRVPLDRHIAMIKVNCIAVAALTHVFLPRMKARGRGAIVIVASAAGYQPVPLAGTYGATKAFDLMLAEALWSENRGSGVDVLALSPGPVDTEFQAVAGETAHAGATPESVVDVALGALGRKPSVVAGGFNKARAWSVRLAPRALVARMAFGVMRGFIPEPMR
jgi:short-subunit dehydrogenase